MNKRQLYELARDIKISSIYLWEYPNRIFVWASAEKSLQLDKQRNEESAANIDMK